MVKNDIVWVRILQLFIMSAYTNYSCLEMVALKGTQAEK